MATQLEWERRIGYGVLLAAALLLTARVLAGIWEALLLAAVLAAALSPVQEWLTARLGRRPNVSALCLTAATLLFVLVPLILLLIYLVSQAIHLVQQVREIASRSGPLEIIQVLPDRLEQIVRKALSHFDLANLGDQVRARGVNALVSLRGAISAMGAFGIQLSLVLIALFLLLSRSKSVAGWLRASAPLAPGDVDILVSDFRAVARNVIGATVITAMVQAMVASIGYYIAGAPTPILFGALTFLAAFIPGLGTPVVGLPLAVFQYFYGRHWQGIFLAIWMMAVVSVIDNVLRPVLMKGGGKAGGGTRVDSTVLFFSLIGGLIAFGGMGLIVGPLAVVLLDSLIRLRPSQGETRA